MNVDDMDEVTIQYAYAYGEWQYQQGYEQGKKDAVKHGHWMESKCLDDCFWVCSCCKFPSQAIAANKLYVYCPNCGAKMDGESNGV